MSGSSLSFIADHVESARGCAHVALVGIDPQTARIAYWNSSAEDLFGYSGTEAMGMPADRLVIPAHRKPVRAYLAGFTASEPREDPLDARDIRLMARKRAGTEFPVEVMVHQETDQGGMVVAIVLDRTAQMRGEAAMRRQIALLVAQQEASPDGILVVDAQRKVLDFNQRFPEMWGLPSSLLTPGDDDPLLARALPLLEHPTDMLARIRHSQENPLAIFRDEIALKDGRIFDSYDSPILSPQGTLYGRILLYRDVTRQRWAEKALNESEDRYRQLVESSPDMVAIHCDGTLAYLNPAGAMLMGANRPEDLYGRSIIEFVHPDYRQMVTARVRYMRETSLGVSLIEEKFLRLDGTTFDVEVVSVPITYRGKPAMQVIARNISKRKSAEALVKRLAYTDALTGLPNRNLFLERLDQVVADARRNGGAVGLLSIDLDRFKVINDTLGHEFGDQMLKAIADRLVALLRTGDEIARIGGDGFVVTMTSLKSSQDAIQLAQRILAGFSRALSVGDHEIYLSASIGIALYPDHGADSNSLVKNADTAMSKAKEHRSTFQLYAPAMSESAVERLVLDSHLHRAIERNELVLHYQPQIDLNTGRIIGAEALVRWQHPELGMVSPAKFIPLAEETGFISPITDWVLRTASQQAKAWFRAGLPPLRMAINISGLYFKQPDTVYRVAEALKEADLPANTLELELTESIFMTDQEETLRSLQSLKEMGVSVSIDDFGTGYSSLSYLKRFPIDMLKIDQSFVRELTVNSDDAAIVRTIVVLAHSLNMRVIAEGVETAEQTAFLESAQCDAVQGYYYSRPLTAEAFADRYL